ncbi:hypothetical protein GQ602_004565 [Ophiocordyceps camponoti-floridani]|uniref:Uncharacterized protein n=1 Tax=Ophiocordyceps camponoti-floridani TaxID=2030778 RepID=A0A8H4VDR3_9HYPO|nr:hypothetical protein GQ602_004565 [Ophiocordyceps camponoti-floridani]
MDPQALKSKRPTPCLNCQQPDASAEACHSCAIQRTHCFDVPSPAKEAARALEAYYEEHRLSLEAGSRYPPGEHPLEAIEWRRLRLTALKACEQPSEPRVQTPPGPNSSLARVNEQPGAFDMSLSFSRSMLSSLSDSLRGMEMLCESMVAGQEMTARTFGRRPTAFNH